MITEIIKSKKIFLKKIQKNNGKTLVKIDFCKKQNMVGISDDSNKNFKTSLESIVDELKTGLHRPTIFPKQLFNDLLFLDDPSILASMAQPTQKYSENFTFEAIISFYKTF